MFHTAVFYGTTAGALTATDVAAVTDGWATVQNSHFIFQEDLQLIQAYGHGITVTSVQLSAPHWRFVAQPTLVPPVQDWDGSEALITPLLRPGNITVPRIDEIQALITTSATSTGGYMVPIWLGRKPMNLNIPAGDVYPTAFTFNNVPATGVWTPYNITFTQSLPAGRYSVVGMDIVGTNIQLGRLRFQEYVMLPGVATRNGATGLQRDVYRYGRLGEWGQFENTAQPTIEIFSMGGATGTNTGVMDLVKIR